MLISTLAALAVFAAPDANQASPAPATETAQTAADAKPKKVCRKMPDVSGSRLSRTVCVTEKPKAEKAPAAAPAETEAKAEQPAA
jgi:hypothetical protein